MKTIFKILTIGMIMFSAVSCDRNRPEFHATSIQDTKHSKVFSSVLANGCVYFFEHNGHEYLTTAGFIYHSESCKCKK